MPSADAPVFAVEPPGPPEPARFEQALGELGRTLAESSTRLHDAFSIRLGIGATDARCLSLISELERSGQVTPTLLATRLGLTSGAVTGLLDRLERAGFVQRERSSKDRRQVLVRSLDARRAELNTLVEASGRAWRKLLEDYSAAELLVIARFVGDSAGLAERYVTELLNAKGLVTDPPE